MSANPTIAATIFTHDRRAEIGVLLDDLVRESAGAVDPQIRVYDDRTPGGIGEIEQRASFYYRTPRHYGRREHWRLWSKAIKDLRDVEADLFLFLPDDARLCKGFFQRALKAWESLPEEGILSLWVQEGREGAQWESAEPVRINRTVIESGWVDGCFLCGRRTLERLHFKVKQPTERWLQTGRSSGVGGFMTRQLRAAEGRMFRVDRSLVLHTGSSSLMNPKERERDPLTTLRFVGDRRKKPPRAPRPSLCFVVPAWKRFALSEVCFSQWKVAIERLAKLDVDAQVVVIANDQNLEIAEAQGFATIRHKQNFLGAKLNAGYAWAAKNGFEYVAALGTDSFFCPERIGQFQMPLHGEMFCTRNYTVVAPDGSAQARLQITWDGGVGTRIFRTEMLEECGYEPVEPQRMSGCDTATLNTLRRAHRIKFLYTSEHPFEILGFMSSKVQITSYQELLNLWLIEPLVEPLAGLDAHYPVELLERALALYNGR